MRYLLLSVLFIPFIAFGQKNMISAQAGYLNTRTVYTLKGRLPGFSNQVAISRFIRHSFSLSLYYEYNKWNDHTVYKNQDVSVITHSFGFSPSVQFDRFYIGPNVQLTSIERPYATHGTGKNGNLNIGFGIHAGALQKIWKNLYVNEQAGYDWNFSRSFYIRAGLAFRFGK